MPLAYKLTTLLWLDLQQMVALILWCLDHVETYFVGELLPLPTPLDH